MFEWLIDEIDSIKTPKFHRVDGPAPAQLRNAVDSCEFPLPPSYKEFVLRFGNANLYRYSDNYYVSVFAGPRMADSTDGESYIEFGQTWTSAAYFKESLLVESDESAVFELFKTGLRKTADGFETWLAAKCAAARKRFRKKDWENIVKGPRPFTDEDRAIVEARRRFRWKVVGIADNGDLQFEVHNTSDRILPYLTIGVREESGEEIGGVKLPVSTVKPGEMKICEVDCYKQWYDPLSIEAFEKPDPGPEDRELYWEFREIN